MRGCRSVQRHGVSAHDPCGSRNAAQHGGFPGRSGVEFTQQFSYCGCILKPSATITRYCGMAHKPRQKRRQTKSRKGRPAAKRTARKQTIAANLDVPFNEVLANNKNQDQFWDALIRSTRAEPRPVRSIPGLSGVVHELVALGVDDKSKRLIVVSPYADAKTTAMMQSDIQGTLEGTKVIAVRPLALDLSHIVRGVVTVLGRTEFFATELEGVSDRSSLVQHALHKALNPQVMEIHRALKAARVDLRAQLLSLIEQFMMIEWRLPSSDNRGFGLSFDGLRTYDAMKEDKKYGVCPIPLYGFSSDEIEGILTNPSPDDVYELLRDHGIMQYFFPPMDQLVLGGIDSGRARLATLREFVGLSDRIGHPVSPGEIVSSVANVKKLEEMLEALVDAGMLRQIDLDYDLSPNGLAARMKVRFAPRESLLMKLSNWLTAANIAKGFISGS